MSIQVALNHSLKTQNTLAIDAVADHYFAAESLDDVQRALEFAKNNSLNVRVLGGGSNVVMADRIEGLVLSFTNAHCQVLEESEDSVLLDVGAGYEWHQFVMDTINNKWFGLENLALIPGTVGAAPVQNIGAYGVEVESFIESVKGVYLESGEPFTLSHSECRFAYRESCFKQELDGKTLITSVQLRLSKVPDVKVSYAPLNAMADEKGIPTPLELAKWVIEVRSSKLPDPKALPNAGSFFKNPVVTKTDYQRLLNEYPDMPSYEQGDLYKIPAGWLIDKMGYKGRVFDGGVAVHKKQALVLTNEGGTGQQVLEAASAIKSAVKDKYGIELEQEPRLFN